MRIASAWLGIIAVGMAALSGCSSSEPAAPQRSTALPPATTTATVAPLTTARAPRPDSSSWSGNGVYSVGDKPSGGAKAAIPSGRYRVELATGSTFGRWYRCTALPCSPTSNNWIDIGSATGPGFTTVVDIASTDGALYMEGVTFFKAD